MWDSFLVVWSFPRVLASSVIETILLAPFLLAAAYTALSCLRPRSRPARRELNRVLNAFASSPLPAAVTMLTLSMVAMIIGVLAVVNPPPMWPLPDLPSMLIHLPDHKAVSLHG